MSQSQIEDEHTYVGNAAAYLSESESISQNSEVVEKFYRIRAVQEGGLPVEIVGLDIEGRFKEFSAKSRPRNVRVYNGEYLDDCDSIETLSDEDNRFVSIRYFPSVFVYYKLPHGGIYKTKLSDLSDHYEKKAKKIPSGRFLSELQTELTSSTASISSISELSTQHSVTATLNPEEDFTDGQLIVGNCDISVDGIEVNVPKTTSDISNDVKFILNESESAYSINGYDNYEFDWYWGHVSDIRETGENISLVVNTPLGDTVFPYHLDHDTDKPLWDIVDYAGGRLQDIRGLDVCVRRRAPYAMEYRRVSELDSFESKRIPQPITDVHPWNDKKFPIVSSLNCQVEPVGADSMFLWELGLPPQDRFSEENIGQGSTSQNKSFLTSLRSKIGL